jgi:hypothetical protein
MSRLSCQVSEGNIHKRAKLKEFLCDCLCCYIREVNLKEKETYIHIAMVLEHYISFLNPCYLISDTLFQFQALNISWNITWKTIGLILPRAHRCVSEGKVFPYSDIEGLDVAERYACTLSLTSALDEGEWLKQRSGLPPGKRPRTHCTVGGLALGPVSTDAVISHSPASKTRISSP